MYIKHQSLFGAIVGVHNARRVGFHADRVDTRIRSASARKFVQRFEYVRVIVMNGFGTGVLR